MHQIELVPGFDDLARQMSAAADADEVAAEAIEAVEYVTFVAAQLRRG